MDIDKLNYLVNEKAFTQLFECILDISQQIIHIRLTEDWIIHISIPSCQTTLHNNHLYHFPYA